MVTRLMACPMRYSDGGIASLAWREPVGGALLRPTVPTLTDDTRLILGFETGNH